MNKHEQKLLNPESWFDFTKKQKHIGDILLSSLISNRENLLKIRENDSTAMEEFITIFSNAHFHWGIAIENGFKGLIVKYKPETIKYKVVGDDLIIEKIAGKSHNLIQLADLTGVLKREGGLYKYEKDYQALIEVLKHLTEMIKWGARYPLPMDTGGVHKFSQKVPSTLVYGFHILDVIDPLFNLFETENNNLNNSK